MKKFIKWVFIVFVLLPVVLVPPLSIINGEVEKYPSLSWAIWGAFVFLLIRLVKKPKEGSKSSSGFFISKAKKQEVEEAEQYIQKCFASEKITDNLKQQSSKTQILPIKRREWLLKNFVSNINHDDVNTESFEKINDLAECLNISTNSVDDEVYKLMVVMFEKEFKAGRFDPESFPVDIPLKKDEIVYFKSASALVETKTTRKYVSGNRGMSFRIAKGVYYRVGGSQGYSQSVKEDVHKTDGELIITNKRIVFAGDIQSFEVYTNKIINYLFKDSMLLVNASNRKEPYRAIVPSELIGCFKACIDWSIKLQNQEQE